MGTFQVSNTHCGLIARFEKRQRHLLVMAAGTVKQQSNRCLIRSSARGLRKRAPKN